MSILTVTPNLSHRGALLASQGVRLCAPAIPVKIAGTVGAGDGFLAGKADTGRLAGLLELRPL